MARRQTGWAVVLIASCTIALLTLLPGPRTSEPAPCCHPADFLLNIVLFVPFGVGLGMAGIPIRRAVIIGALASAAVETAQIWIPGRFAEILDVISNTGGTLLGTAIVAGWASRARWWRTIGPTLAVLTAFSWLAAARLIRPSIPRTDHEWWAEHRPEVAGRPRFPGKVLEVMLQGTSLPDGAIPQSADLATRLARADTVILKASIESGAPVSERSAILEVYMGVTRQYMSLWQEGRDLIVYQRLAMADWGFRPPSLRIQDALPTGAGKPVEVEVRSSRGSLEAAVGNGSIRREAVTLAAEQFWTGFLPFSYTASRGPTVWPALLALGTFLIAGAGIGGRPVLLAVMLGISLGAAPMLGTAPFPSWLVLGAAVLGLWAGYRVAQRIGLVP